MLELNNIVNENYTGIFSTTLSITFHAPTNDFPKARSADFVLPLTTRSKSTSQMLIYPGDTRVNLELPANTAHAWLEVIATGAAEEVRLAVHPLPLHELNSCRSIGVLLRQLA